MNAGDYVQCNHDISSLSGMVTIAAGTTFEVLGFRDRNRGVVELCADLAYPNTSNVVAYVAPRFLRVVK